MKTSSAWSLALAAVLLAGCAPATVQTYEGPAKDRSQIAVLKGISAEAAGTGKNYYVFFVSYAKLVPETKPTFIKVGDSFSGYPRELTMLPGRYVVMTRCATGNEYAFPAIRMVLEAGGAYEVKCVPVPDRLSRVRLLARRVGGAQGTPDQVSDDKLDDLLPLLK